MFQLTYQLKDIDAFTHQITQFGARFLSKGPEAEVYFHVPKFQLRLTSGTKAEVTVIMPHDHYQKFVSMDISEPEQMRTLLRTLHEERGELSKQVIRYHLKQVLIELHRYGTNVGTLLCLIAPDLDRLKNLARQLSLDERSRTEKTSADLAE